MILHGHVGVHMVEDKTIHLLKNNEGLSEDMEPQNPVGDHHVPCLNGHIWGTHLPPNMMHRLSTCPTCCAEWRFLATGDGCAAPWRFLSLVAAAVNTEDRGWRGSGAALAAAEFWSSDCWFWGKNGVKYWKTLGFINPQVVGVPRYQMVIIWYLVHRYAPKWNSLGIYWSRIDITGNTMKHQLCFDSFDMD